MQNRGDNRFWLGFHKYTNNHFHTLCRLSVSNIASLFRGHMQLFSSGKVVFIIFLTYFVKFK